MGYWVAGLKILRSDPDNKKGDNWRVKPPGTNGLSSTNRSFSVLFLLIRLLCEDKLVQQYPGTSPGQRCWDICDDSS